MYGWGSWERIQVGDEIFLGVYHSIVLSYIDLFLNSVIWNSNSFLNSVMWKFIFGDKVVLERIHF